ncbi:MAG TPA: HxsD-like protein [bacterium]|nr:HxsD-like protein [bacterium]
MEYRFDKSIYKPRAVKKAVRDYSGVVDIKSKDSDDYISVWIENIPEPEAEVIAGEFCNYTLFLMKAT